MTKHLRVLMFAVVAVIVSCCGVSSGFAADKVNKIVMASPFSPLVMPMTYMLENGLLNDIADQVELKIWNTPDQLRVMMTKGSADFISVPSNIASIFHNKGIDLSLSRVSIWGVFYLISKDPAVTALAQLKGQRIFLPFRGDQPDLIFQTICRAQGLDPLKDFDLQYVASPLDITMSLLAGKVDHAVMIEPAAAMCILKARSKGLDFRRAINIQTEYGKATRTTAGIPNAGVAVLPRIIQNRAVVETFLARYDKSVQWVTENPAAAAKLAAKHVAGINAKAFEEALKYTVFTSVSGKDARKELERMFSAFMDINPKSIGGTLPSDAFYR